MIYVIAYDHEHRKSEDVLIALRARGYKDVKVLFQKWTERQNHEPLLPHRFLKPRYHPKDLCMSFEYIYDELKLSMKLDGKILIAGAGILPSHFVNNNTVINSHPGYLPNVRGLDALKWAIYDGQPIGVTTHIVDERPDCGTLIERRLVSLNSWDTFHSIAVRQYELEIEMLVDAIEATPACEKLTAEYDVHRRMPARKEMELTKRLGRILENYE